MPRQHVGVLSALIGAVAGQGVLIGTAWLLPFASEYAHTDDTISELALGRHGYLQTIAFVLAGLGTLGLSFALRLVMPTSKLSAVGAVLLGLQGVALLASGIFPTDPVDDAVDVAGLTPSGVVHVIAAILGFVCGVAAMVVFTWAFARSRQWQRFTPWSGLLATGGVTLLLAQSAQGSLVGLMQRLLATVIAAWIILVALRARSVATSLGYAPAG